MLEENIDLESELNKGAILLDVRELDEWNEKHFQKAIHFPFSKFEKMEIPTEIPSELPKNASIFIHCAKGGRAKRTEAFLKPFFPNSKAITMSFDEIQQKYNLEIIKK